MNTTLGAPLTSEWPATYTTLLQRSQDLGFSMPCDLAVAQLLRTLVATKPLGRVLELGTGMGLSLSWMLDGLGKEGTIVSLDNDNGLTREVRNVLGNDKRLEVLTVDAGEWLMEYKGPAFDIIFADAWPGKYSLLEKALALLDTGGMYVIDDMLPQENWPDGHAIKAAGLIDILRKRKDFLFVEAGWASGLMIGTKIE